MRRSPITAVAGAAVMLLAACGSGAAGDGGSDGARLEVVASVYPLEHIVEQVAGDVDIRVLTLTAAGADPHDVELSPRDVAGMGTADLVVYSAGFQPAVDDAVASQAGDRALDLAEVVDLLSVGAGGHEPPGEELADEDHGEHAGDEDAHEDADDGHGHDHGGVDPHFWLDPVRYATATEAVAERMGQADPDNADRYAANAAAFVAELETLDAEFSQGLAECVHTDVVTTHAAFGYLTGRYGLHQIEMTGLAPESEPSPARVAEVVELVRGLGVGAIYAEVIAGGALAETVARETGGQVLLLDPLEGITDASPGQDYLAIMRANLEALRAGQECS